MGGATGFAACLTCAGLATDQPMRYFYGEISSKPCNDAIGTNQVVTIRETLEASCITLNGQRITQRTITKLKLTIDITGLLLVWPKAGSI